MALLRWYGSPGFFDSGLQVICIVGSGVSHLRIPLYGVQVRRRESKTLNSREVPETFFYKINLFLTRKSANAASLVCVHASLFV